MLGLQPAAVILTDADLWLGEAIQDAWRCVHHLCTWHLSKNLLRNVRHCFSSSSGPTAQSSKWTTFLRMWWVICWKSDTSLCNTFDAEWRELRQYLIDNATHPYSHAVQKSLRWLGGPGDCPDNTAFDEHDNEVGSAASSADGNHSGVTGGGQQQQDQHSTVDNNDEAHRSDGNQYPDQEQVADGTYYNIYSLRYKWASRYTSSVYTHGASSTQRGEQIFAGVKAYMEGGCG